MSVIGAALRGFGRALKKGKHLRSSKTGAIKSVKPGVGGLKKSREMFESLQKSTATGVKKFGRPHKQGGDLERAKKKLEKITGQKIGELKIPKGKK